MLHWDAIYGVYTYIIINIYIYVYIYILDKVIVQIDTHVHSDTLKFF